MTTHGTPDIGRFQIYTAEDFKNLLPIEWRVRDVFPTTGLACIFGPSGAGKSFILIDLVAAIGEGKDWFGHKTKPCKILCVVLEGQAGFRQRIVAWEKYNGRAFPSNVSFMFEPFGLTVNKDVVDLWAAMGTGFDLIVIDTLNRAAPNADENSSQNMGQVLSGATQLQTLTKGLVILVHHSGKVLSRGMRGHSSLNAAMDATLEVSREGNNRICKQLKAKDGEDGQIYAFELTDVELDASDDEGPTWSCVVTPKDRTGNLEFPVMQPKGANQTIVMDALLALLEVSADVGQAGAPPDVHCVELDEAVTQIKDQLPIEPKRQAERTKDAIKQFVTYGWFKLEDGWLWKV